MHGLLRALSIVLIALVTFPVGTANAQPAAPLSGAKKKPKKKRKPPPPKPAPSRENDVDRDRERDRLPERERDSDGERDRAIDRDAPPREPDAPRAREPERPSEPPPDNAPADGASADSAAADSRATEPPPDEDDEKTPALGAISGRAFAYGRASDDADLYQQISASLWLEVKPRFTKATYAKVALSGDVLDSSFATDHVRGRVREGFVGLRDGGWDLRLGQQMISWGSADFLNPTDLVGARDYTFFSTDPEVSRKGSLSTFVSYAVPDTGFELTFVTTPFFPESRVIVPPGAIPQGARVNDPVRPEWRFDRIELAAKAKYAGDGWDVALIGFHGFDHSPHFEPGVLDPVRGAFVEQRFHRHSAVGLDASATAGAWVVKLEGALVQTGNPNEGERWAPPSSATGVFGIERAFFERLRVQTQLVARLNYPVYRPPPNPATLADPRVQLEQAVERANDLVFNNQEILRTAGTLRLAYETEDEKLSAEGAAFVNFVGGDFIARVMVGYRPLEPLLFQLGYEQFAGPRSRPFGALRPLSGAFLQATFTF